MSWTSTFLTLHSGRSGIIACRFSFLIFIGSFLTLFHGKKHFFSAKLFYAIVSEHLYFPGFGYKEFAYKRTQIWLHLVTLSLCFYLPRLVPERIINQSTSLYNICSCICPASLTSWLHPLGGCREQPPGGAPWVSGLVGHFVQTWPDSECSHTVQFLESAVLRLQNRKFFVISSS